jgi:diguanylate cyclase (GGDEF)-like protein
VAAALQRCAPAEALVARYGGEEFACLLPGADVVQARALAEALRAEVAAQSVRLPGVEVPQTLTISAGVASLSLEAPADAQRLLRAADLALYAAKGAGRNCVRG